MAESADTDAPATRRAARRVLAGFGFPLWVLLISLIALPYVFHAEAKVGPGRFDFEFRPSTRGNTEIVLAPLGSLSARTHDAPVKLRIGLQEVDVVDALGAASNGGTRTLEKQIRDGLPGAATQVLLRLAAVSALVGAGAALTFPGRRTLRRLLLGSVISVAATVALAAPVALSYNPDQLFSKPELRGQLAASDSLVARATSLNSSFGNVASRSEVLSRRIAELYSSATTKAIARAEGDVVLLHVSDLHLNGVGLSLAKDLAERFRVDAVVDTGDFTSFGFQPEAGFTDQLKGFKVPYYLVPGNHDSPEVRRELRRSPYIHYLDDELVTVKGVRILGIPDPTNTALRIIPREQVDETYRNQFPKTTRLVARTQPDLVLVHNPVQLRPALGKVPVAAAGHLHLTRLSVIRGTTVAVVGSSGATGLGNLLVDKTQPYRFELLRFSNRKLVAVDQIELNGDGGDFTLRRIMIRPEQPDTTDRLPEPATDEPSREQIENEDPEVLDAVTSTTSTTATTALSPVDAPASTAPEDQGPQTTGQPEVPDAGGG